MKRTSGLIVFLLSTWFSVCAQVDSSYIYNTSMPYGTLDIRVAKSATRYYYLEEGKTFSFRESAPGVKTHTWRDMTSWNSSQYGQGNLREKNGSQDYFVMNYRVLFPDDYDADFSPGYPIIFVLHGAGEAGNCWGENCHWSTTSWNPNSNDPPAPTDEFEELLNNDRNLFHGGQQHLNAVNLAGSKLPGDPTLSDKAFPGFVIFPQSLNGWMQPSKVEDAIRLLRLFVKKYNIDENRIYIHGLSNGGAGVNQAIKRAPWLFAAALGMSAVTDGEIAVNNMLAEVGKLPLWYFQGGQDTNPTPVKTFNFVKKLRDAGAVVRYYFYPTLGHGTWNTAYKEPDFFSWILSKRKYNPHIFYGYAAICNTTGAGARIGFSKGFLAYQWEKDGEIISGADDAEYIATTPGTYRGRFSRLSANPSAGQWEPWSEPIQVTEVEPAKPSILVTGTTHLRGPGLASNDANNTVILTSSATAELYNWYKNGQLINFQNTEIDDTLKTATFTTGSVSASGAYTLVIKNSNCPSPTSDPVQLFFNNSAPVNITLNSAEVNFSGIATSSTVFLTWNDVLATETGYEIWRKKSGESDFRFVTKTSKDAVSFLDTSLEPATNYLYKFRAINNTGRSNYIPSDNLNTNYTITTLADETAPGAPQNLAVVSNLIDQITISWQPAHDNVGIKEYVIHYGNSQVTVPGNTTKFTITGLTVNTVYPITLQAVDYASHISQHSNQVQGTTYVSSLTYKHSTGVWTDLDDITLTQTFVYPEFTGSINNFSLAGRTQEDYFNFQFTGYINIPQDTMYAFRTTSDDGSRLLIDNVIIVDNDGKHGNRTVSTDSIHLSAGLHTIEVQYFDNNGNQNLVVQYMGPGIGDGLTWTTIPDEALKSGTYTPPLPPSSPNSLTATAAGMQKINLSWQFADDAGTDFEIFRATSTGGPYSMVARVPDLTATDSVYLIPGTTYYYQVRTVNSGGVSAFTSTASATTSADNQDPSTPAGLTLQSKTPTTAAFSWTASSDNTGVTGYDIFANNVKIGTSEVPSFTADGLIGMTYSFTVRAFDASGNRSAASSALIVDNSIPGMYYSLPTGDLNAVTTWKKNPDGTGASPANFSENGQTFVINDRPSVALQTPWAVTGSGSKVIVSEGTSLELNATCACALELQGNSKLILNNDTLPTLSSISPESTIQFHHVDTIPAYEFGNVVLSGGSTKIFQGINTNILGNLSVEEGLQISGSSAIPEIRVHGDLDFSGPPAFLNIHVIFAGNTLHTLQAPGDLSIHQITAEENSTVNFVTSNAASLTVGSGSGGGLTLHASSLLSIGASSLILTEAGLINSAMETGRISVDLGNITLASHAAGTSNLYFDPSHNVVTNLEINLSGGGTAGIGELLRIQEGIRMKSGQLSANGNIMLLTNSDRTAVIYPVAEGASITGDVRIQHLINPGMTHEVSSAVAGATISQLQEHFPITGNFTGSSVGDGLPYTPSFFTYNDQSGSLTPYPAEGASNSSPLEAALGYNTFIYPQSEITVDTFEVKGNPHQGTISFPLNANASGTVSQGWNLLGNPYASPISWLNDNTWTRSGVSDIIAVRQQSEVNGEMVSQYQYYDLALWGGRLEPGQAFWIQSTAPSPSLTITESAKVDPLQAAMQEPQTKYLVVSVSQGDMTDPAYIKFSTSATDGYEPQTDAFKRKNEGVFNFATVVEGTTSLAVNTLSDSYCEKVIRFDLQDIGPGSYTLSFDNFEILSDLQKVVLRDHFTGTEISVNGSPYDFTVTSEASSYGAERFELVLSKNLIDVESPVISATDVCSDLDAAILVAGAHPNVAYTAFSVNGTMASDVTVSSGDSVTITIPNARLAEGTNRFTVEASFEGCATKMFADTLTIFRYAPVTVSLDSSASICQGSNITVTASGAPEGGSYQWLDADGVLVPDVSGETLLMDSVLRDTLVQVSAVNAFGCVGPAKVIHVKMIMAETPVISRASDTLSVVPQENYTYQWFRDGDLFEGATGDFIVPEDSGSYSVTATTAEGCSASSDSYEFKPSEEDEDETDNEDVVGVQDPLQSFMLEVYPVPGNGSNVSLRVYSPNKKDDISIRVISLTGREYYRATHPMRDLEHGHRISGDRAFPNGMYVVIAIQGDTEVRGKIIISD